MVHRVSIGLLILMLVALPAAAQQEKGDKELQASLNMSLTTGNDQTTGSGTMNFVFGYYLTRQFELRGGGGVGLSTVPACSHAQVIGGVASCDEFARSQLVGNPTITGGFVTTFAGKGKTTVPYVGVDYAAIGVHGGPILSLTSGTVTQTFLLNWTNNIRPNGGVKFFLRRNIALDVNGGWDKDFGSNASGVNTIDSRIGFSYVF